MIAGNGKDLDVVLAKTQEETLAGLECLPRGNGTVENVTRDEDAGDILLAGNRHKLVNDVNLLLDHRQAVDALADVKVCDMQQLQGLQLLVIEPAVAVAFEFRVCDLVTKLLAHAVVLFAYLHFAWAIALTFEDSRANLVDVLAVLVHPNSHNGPFHDDTRELITREGRACTQARFGYSDVAGASKTPAQCGQRVAPTLTSSRQNGQQGASGSGIVLLAHAPHLVHALDKAEHDEGDDEEVDAGTDERPEVDSRSWNDQTPDLGISTRDEVNERLDDVRSQRRNDCRQRTANDDADGHVHHVALVDELLELLEETHDVLLCSSWQRRIHIICDQEENGETMARLCPLLGDSKFAARALVREEVEDGRIECSENELAHVLPHHHREKRRATLAVSKAQPMPMPKATVM